MIKHEHKLWRIIRLTQRAQENKGLGGGSVDLRMLRSQPTLKVLLFKYRSCCQLLLTVTNTYQIFLSVGNVSPGCNLNLPDLHGVQTSGLHFRSSRLLGKKQKFNHGHHTFQRLQLSERHPRPMNLKGTNRRSRLINVSMYSLWFLPVW